MKGIVNDDLTIIILKPMRGRGTAAQKISFWLAIYLDQ